MKVWIVQRSGGCDGESGSCESEEEIRGVYAEVGFAREEAATWAAHLNKKILAHYRKFVPATNLSDPVWIAENTWGKDRDGEWRRRGALGETIEVRSFKLIVRQRERSGVWPFKVSG